MKSRDFSARFFGVSILVLVTNFQAMQVNAASEITPTLGFEQNFVDEKNDDGDESGAVSVISPGINYLLTTPNTNLSLSYVVESISYSGLDRSDQTQPNLDLAAEITHQPGRWTTEITSSIEQSNANIDGIRSINDDLLNDDSQELRTLDVNTRFVGKLGSTVEYQTNLGVDASDFEDSDETQGATLGLSMDNFRSGSTFTWGSALASQIAEDEGGDEEQIDSLALNFNYRINLRWQTFTDLTTYETDEDELSQDSILVGIFWTPKPETSVRLGVGELDNNESYSLDVQTEKRRMRFTARYAEGITSARFETLNELSENLLSTLTSQSISIDPVVQKRMDVGFDLDGKRSTFGLDLFEYTRDPVVSEDRERGSGIELRFSRRLPRMATAGINISGEKTKLTQTSDLAEIDIYFRKSQTENLVWDVNLVFSEQSSSLAENEYERVQLGYSLLYSF